MGNAPPTPQQQSHHHHHHQHDHQGGPYRNSNSSNTSHTDTSADEATSASGGSQSLSQSAAPSQSYYSSQQQQPNNKNKKATTPSSSKSKAKGGRMRSFPGSVLLESAMCGGIDLTDDHSRTAGSDQERLWKRVDQFGLCAGASPSFDGGGGGENQQHRNGDHSHNSLSEYSDDDSSKIIDAGSTNGGGGGPNSNSNNSNPTPATPNATSALFARALISEVTDNPKTMTPAAMADREKKLLKAQKAATKSKKGSSKDGPRPVGAPGGIGQPNLLGSIAQAITGGGGNSGSGNHNNGDTNKPTTPSSSVLPPNSLQENRAQQQYPQNNNAESSNGGAGQTDHSGGKYSVTIGLSLSRRHSTVGHPDTVTRQTAFDFNELQDRQYKYVSSTDSSGWRAGGGERGGDQSQMASEGADALVDDFGSASLHPHGVPNHNKNGSGPGSKTFSPTAASVSSQSQPAQQFHKVAAPDTVHIPIIQIDADSPQAVDAIINALARGEIFIPHMAVLPESLSVNGISPPDLVVRFGCERNDDVPPDEWPNWCLEFMHNQLYEYFYNMGARWTKRPFSITLARKVRWKTVKHMNRYFAHAERVIDAWREKGPQYLDPQLSYIEGGATPEEVARPHGIYLLRNGVPTNYFAPNFDPPYTTKMTRSLLLNVLGKSWDKKRREWTTEPIPRLVTPSMLMASMCGCADPGTGGFMANEVTHVGTTLGASQISDQRLVTHDQQHYQQNQHQQQQPPPSQEKNRNKNSGAAIMGPAPPTPAGVVAVNDGTPRSNAASSSAANYSHQSGINNNNSSSRRKQKHQSQQQQQSNNMHEASQLSSASPQSQIKSPVNQQSPTMSGHSTSNAQEEKKVDDEYRRQGPSEPAGKYMTFQQQQDQATAVSQQQQQHRGAHSEVGRSVANSGTSTVRHTNHLMASTQGPSMEEKQTISSSSWRKKNGREGGGGSPLASATNRSPKNSSPSNQNLPNADSGFSLDYSIDSSNFLNPTDSLNGGGQEQQQPRSGGNGNGGGSMMMQFAESSQASSKQQRNARQIVEQRQQRQPPQQKQQQQPRPSAVTEDEDLNLQESISSNEVVPSDEELFTVGWAKAMDPGSGNYYYFTLDRAKTVWENPLSADTFVSGESSYVSGQR